MKILMLLLIGMNLLFYLYFLFKEMKRYREVELNKLETFGESEETKEFDVEKLFRKNILGVFVITFVMTVSVVGKEPFSFKNLSNFTVILMIFNTLYIEYINRNLKKMDLFDENLKKQLLVAGNYVLPIITIILIILQKLFIK